MQYNYYWYHHLSVPSEVCDWINERIESHDWQAYCLVCKLYKNTKKVTYFPNNIYKIDIDSNSNEKLELTEETFNLITHSECECG